MNGRRAGSGFIEGADTDPLTVIANCLGVWLSKCGAMCLTAGPVPRASSPSGSRQLPGNIQIPSDIATAPAVTKDPPGPIRVPSDIATVSTVSQGNELVS